MFLRTGSFAFLGTLAIFWMGLACSYSGEPSTEKKPSPRTSAPTKAQPKAAQKQPMTQTLYDFKSTGKLGEWYVVNDGVMGGVSSSQIRISKEKTAVFEGTVSLENYGGFASIRSGPASYALQGFKGIRLRIKGDKKTYKLNVRTNRRFDGVVYQRRFNTTGEWQTVDIPFSELWAGYHGRKMSGMGALDPSKIQNLGFLIADKQTGIFRLEIASIQAYR